MRNRKDRPEPMVRLNFYLTIDQLQAVRDEADKQDITVAEVVRQLIDKHLMKEKV